ncbi:MAG: 2,3-bisphosphoglycerate-independent phosphoglycerate mutase [bacterium]|nr:2,3-bisphosphoglycerate-independent phosphoglycerate mutase [Gammaproteobacteria bacterium]HIL95349.1 2,3-bisphosphoglycerate-independent phosphoglycerate mutase [Pseudomonadales bacterium]
MSEKTPYVLIILDGWGHRDESDANAIQLANSPVWDELWRDRPHCLISGSGPDVGLPSGQMGNSEVGHMNLGAGRVVDQDFTRITKSIQSGSFFENPAITAMAQTLARTGKALHLFGLLSPGGVHSHTDHIKAAVKLAFDQNVSAVYVHAFLDGRDVPPRSAMNSLRDMQETIQQLAKSSSKGGIATIIGRYYAMDRDNRWERVVRAYDLVTTGQAEFSYTDPQTALKAAYARDESDEFVQASAISTDGNPVRINDGDAILFMNFRADRAREITHAFVDDSFDGFERNYRPDLSNFVTLTQYAADIDTPCAYTRDALTNSLGEYIASLGKSQLRLAETEKYAHVTFFFSGGREEPFTGESRKLIPSPAVATYDLQPSMSAPEVTDILVKAIKSRSYDLIICNYANGDMVGHTGNIEASIEAVECIDACLDRIVTALQTVAGHGLITADHGNVEQMTDHTTGQAHTAHTSELVPLVYIGDQPIGLRQTGGTLSDVSPTLLKIMNLAQPVEMTGESLVDSA